MLNMIIDAHTHVFSPSVIEKREEYCSTDACFGSLYSNPAARINSAEDLIRSMDENGIAKSVIQNIGWVSHNACLRSNDYILESVSKYADRLTGFCAVQPLAREEALNEIIRCGKGGAKGIGELRPDIQGFDLCDTILMKPLMAEITRRGMVVSLHASEPVGHIYAGKGNVTPRILCDFISSFREVNIILAHFGGGLLFYELMPEVKDVLANTYYDTAAAPFLYRPDIYKVAMGIVGPEKMLFGSDWPLLAPQRVIEHIKAAGLNQAELDSILGENAQRLFNPEENKIAYGR
jgi:predicted TIM-barrel fold metal-dependent hydrolase